MSFLTCLGFSPHMGATIYLQTNSYETRFDVYVEKTARELGLKGWVRMTRLPLYKKAEIELEGRKSTIEKFLKRLNDAPPDARAARAEVQWKTYKNAHQNFRIKS